MAFAIPMEQRPPISFMRDAGGLALEELLGEARDSFAAELAIPLTVQQPPALWDKDARGERIYTNARAPTIGLSMSPAMYRRLGQPGDTYGNVFPVARALYDGEGWCRGRHLEGRGGPWTDHATDVEIGANLQRPLCARLAWYAIVWRMQPVWSASHENLALPIVRRLLLGALRHMWDQRREWAYSDDSGVGEVLAKQRRERRDARRRAEASRSVGVRCRNCRRPYDPTSLEPCPAIEQSDAVAALYPGASVLCAPESDS